MRSFFVLANGFLLVAGNLFKCLNQPVVFSHLMQLLFRQFVLVNEYGTLMTLRRFPKLVLIKAKVKDDCIEINAEGMEPLKLPLEMKEEDGKFLQEIE